MPLSCRFYNRRLPEIEEVIMVKVEKIAEMGAYVHILGYNNIEGMILLSELSRRRIRSINKLIRVGRNEVVVVIRVDREKGYIDLSKRRVLQTDVPKCEDRFAKAKAVNSILRHVADKLGYTTDEQLEDLCERTAWYFDEKLKKDAISYDVFKQVVNDPTMLDECPISAEEKAELLENIRRRLMPQAVKIRSDIEVACYGYEGIEAVKESLKAGLACSTADMPIKINLIAPPEYVVTTSTLEKDEGVQSLRTAIESVREKIESLGGNFRVKMEPKVVTEVEETQLAKQLEQLELENLEVAGDDDDDDGEITGDFDEGDVIQEA